MESNNFKTIIDSSSKSDVSKNHCNETFEEYTEVYNEHSKLADKSANNKETKKKIRFMATTNEKLPLENSSEKPKSKSTSILKTMSLKS